MSAPHDLIRACYAAFNARDIDAALEGLSPDVDWPDVMDGGRLLGHQAVREYWMRQFENGRPHVEPQAIAQDEHGQVVVDVHQVVRDLDGGVIVDQHLQHVCTIDDGLIARMEIRPHSNIRHVVVVGRSPQKMRQALEVLESAGFAATGTFSRDEVMAAITAQATLFAMAAITAQATLFAVVAGGSVDRVAEVQLRAAAEAKGGQLIRANIGDSDPAEHFIDHVLPQLEALR
jgi:hypothetical protein